jgi:Tfp pilus assembly protein PilF
MVRRSFSFRVLIVTVVLGAVLAGGLAGLHRWQIGRTAKGLLALADAKEKDEPLKAAEYLDRYLRLQSGDSAARIRLAKTFGAIAKKDPRQSNRAANLYYRALSTGETKSEVQLRSELAELLLNTNRLREAEQEADAILKKDPANCLAKRVRAMAMSGQYLISPKWKPPEDLQLLAKIKEARLCNQGDPGLALRAAQLYLQHPEVVLADEPTLKDERAHRRRAKECLDELVRSSPDDAKAYLSRYGFLIHEALNASSVQAKAAAAKEAASDLAKALELAPEDPDVLLAAGNDALEQAKRVKQAKGEPAVVQELLANAVRYFEPVARLEKFEQRPEGAIGLGAARLEAGDINLAIAAWRDGFAKVKDIQGPPTLLLQFHSQIAEACIEHGRLSEAGEVLDQIDGILRGLSGVYSEQQRSLDHSQQLRRGRWHLKKGDVAAALPLLTNIVSTHAPTTNQLPTTLDALWLLGNTYAGMGDWKSAAATYEEATRLAPNMHLMRLAAATAWLFAGRADEALRQADAALRLPNGTTPEALHALARAELQVQRAVHPTLRNWDRLAQTLETLEKDRDKLATSTPWQLDLLRVDYLAASAGVQPAAAALRAAEARFGKEQNFWPAACLAYAALQEHGDADRALAAFRKGATKAQAAILEARLASQRKDHVRAKTVLKQASVGATTQEQGMLQAVVMQVAMSEGDLDTVRNYLLGQQNLNPKNVAILRRLAEIDLERRDMKAVEQWEQALLATGPHNAHWVGYYRAWRTFLSIPKHDVAALTNVLTQIEAVVSAKPAWTEAVALQGLIKQRLNLREEAVKDLETAVRLGERRTIIFEQLIFLLDQLHRHEDVKRYLARLEADMPLSQALAEMATLQQLRDGESQGGLAIARRNAALRPNDPQASLWLARLLVINNLPVEAEIEFFRTIELAPSKMQPWDELLSLYSRGDRSKQTPSIRALLKRLESNSDLKANEKQLLLGSIHQLLGDTKAAGASFAQAAIDDQGDLATRLRAAQFFMKSDPQKAKEHLEAALQIDKQSVAAKRLLAIVHTALDDLPAAEELLSATNTSGVTEAEDARLRVVLLMQQGGQANLARAISLMEDIIGRSEVVLMDRMLLARLYEQQAQITTDKVLAAARRTLAREQLELVAEDRGAEPVHLVALIQFLWREGEHDRARLWLERLERRLESTPKDDPQSIVLLIQAQIRTDSTANADKWLKRLQAAEPSPSLRPAVLRAHVAQSVLKGKADVEAIIQPEADRLLIATAPSAAEKQRLYRAIGDAYLGLQQYPAAEKWYSRLAAEVPSEYPALVSALTRQGRIAKAIDLCVQAFKSDASVKPALVLAKVLESPSATPDDRKRADQYLVDALKKFDQDARLLYSVAMVRLFQAHQDRSRENESIDLFRKVVQLSPRFIPALNNLAMILAERPADQAEALELIDKAIVIAGDDPNLLDTKGSILLYSGRWQEALPLCQAATRDAHADPRHHFHLAVAYFKLGQMRDAKQQLEIALDRQLDKQILTPTDKKLLDELRAAPQLELAAKSTNPTSTP